MWFHLLLRTKEYASYSITSYDSLINFLFNLNIFGVWTDNEQTKQQSESSWLKVMHEYFLQFVTNHFVLPWIWIPAAIGPPWTFLFVIYSNDVDTVTACCAFLREGKLWRMYSQLPLSRLFSIFSFKHKIIDGFFHACCEIFSYIENLAYYITEDTSFPILWAAVYEWYIH